MNLIATSRILSLSSASTTLAELPMPRSAIFMYLGCPLRGFGVVGVSSTVVGVECVWSRDASL